MVKAEGGDQMLMLRQNGDGTADCRRIDGDGVIRQEVYFLSSLRPMREVFQTKSCWPQTNGTDLLEIEKEERAAADARRAQRKASRKAKRSNKIKRQVSS